MDTPMIETNRISEDRIPEQPTMAQLESVCPSYRHDFGLLSIDEKNHVMSDAMSWWRAVAKELNRLA
ncbi:hypothetical protein [Vibrio sp.]|uniref:hypothetical protein n=1 Tax=Vibrio sp. TaxID=678 RepID=UPI003D13B87F